MQETIGLRERHRSDTWRAIRVAAGELVTENGLSGTTVEAIASQAGVSRRTFFNYFQSKEDAVLGTCMPIVPDDALAEFDRTAGDDLFTRTVRLLAATSISTLRDDIPLSHHRELAKRFPELRLRLAQYVAAAEHLVEQLLEQRVTRGAVVLAGSDLAPVDAVRALVVMAGAAMRFAYARNPTLSSVPSGPELDSAISLFRTVMKEAT
jgi:AcrR family transcriptional regulator